MMFNQQLFHNRKCYILTDINSKTVSTVSPCVSDGLLRLVLVENLSSIGNNRHQLTRTLCS